MEPLISQFQYLSDAVDEIDRLAEAIQNESDKSIKKELLKTLRELSAAFERHIGRKTFIQF